MSNLRTALGKLHNAVARLAGRTRTQYWRARMGQVGTGSRIGADVRIYVPRQVHLGERVVINSFVHIWAGGGLRIGDDTLIAAHVVITTQQHAVDALARGVLYRETSESESIDIGRNVWVGSSAVLLPGVRVGDNSIVAAGAVVTRDVPANVLVAGLPARVIKRLDG